MNSSDLPPHILRLMDPKDRERLRRPYQTVEQIVERANAQDALTNVEVQKTTDEERLNKTETAYLAYLRGLREPHAWIGVQNVTLKLADDCRLTPDFSFISALGRIVFVDVKGWQREDALIKMRVAARAFPWAEFWIVKKSPEGWTQETVKP